MARDVFISYASIDRLTVDKVVALLEASGIACWMAPRNIKVGESYGKAIIEAIRECPVLVAVFSAAANESVAVTNEVERAFHANKAIFAFRIEDVPANEDLDYFVARSRWLNGYAGSLEENVGRLVEVLSAPVALGRKSRPVPLAPAEASAIPSVPPGRDPSPRAVARAESTAEPISTPSGPDQPLPLPDGDFSRRPLRRPAWRRSYYWLALVPALAVAGFAGRKLLTGRMATGTAPIRRRLESRPRGPGIPWSKNLPEAVANSRASGKPTMVYFYLPGDANCIKLETYTLSDPIVVAAAQRVVAVKLNIRTDGAEAAKRYGIRGVVPSIVFADAAGTVLGKPYLIDSYPAEFVLQMAAGIEGGQFAKLLGHFQKGDGDAKTLTAITAIYAGRRDEASVGEAVSELLRADPTNANGTVATALNLAGDCLQNDNKLGPALDYFRKAEQLAKAPGDAEYALLSEEACSTAVDDQIGDLNRFLVLDPTERFELDAESDWDGLYRSGHGSPSISKAMLNWFTKAADMGYGHAQAALAGIYLNGEYGVSKNLAEAFRWFSAGADAGDPGAEEQVGRMYENGQGTDRDEVRALDWYRKAAGAGNAAADQELGSMYLNGHGVKQDYPAAMSWYQKAASGGNHMAENQLGWMYHNGLSVGADDQKAFDWYTKSAQGGNPTAMWNLSLMYLNGGYFVKRDPKKALDWIRKAAVGHISYAEYEMGRRTRDGDGLDKDLVRAQAWFRRAADDGDSRAKTALDQMH